MAHLVIERCIAVSDDFLGFEGGDLGGRITGGTENFGIVFSNGGGRAVDLRAAMREALQKWNRANPESPIRISFTQVRKRLAAMREDKATRLAKTAPKEIRAAVRRELEGHDNNPVSDLRPILAEAIAQQRPDGQRLSLIHISKPTRPY